MTNLTPLVDQKLIDSANAELKTATDKLSAATAALLPMQAYAAAAWQQAEAAIAANDSDAMDLAEGSDLAARRLAVGVRIRDAAAQAVQTAREGVVTATSVAMRGVYVDGVKKRVAAATRADAARRALSEAEGDYKAATDIITGAIQAGCQDVLFGVHWQHALADAATEIHRWTVGYHQNWWNPNFITA
jgi:hypothetical protein